MLPVIKMAVKRIVLALTSTCVVTVTLTSAGQSIAPGTGMKWKEKSPTLSTTQKPGHAKAQLAPVDGLNADFTMVAAPAVPESAISIPPTDMGGINFARIEISPDQLAALTVKFTQSGSLDSSGDFRWEGGCPPPDRSTKPPTPAAKCYLVIGFSPSTNKDEVVTMTSSNTVYTVTGHTTQNTADCLSPGNWLAPLTRKPALTGNETDPTVRQLESRLQIDLGLGLQSLYCFYQQDGPVKYLSQVKSIFDSAAGSTTISGDIGSLAFPGGVQLVIATNVTAGGSGTTPADQTVVKSEARRFASTNITALPMLSSDQAAQAARNLVNGGSLLIRATWPLLYISPKYKNFTLESFVIGREGLDIPNFSGSNTVLSDPVSHFNLANEWYLQFDALSAAAGGKGDSAGQVFIDGWYGFNDVSHEFAREGGFGNKNRSFMRQISGGIVITNKVSLAAQRNFGPSQKWTDSTTGLISTANNFKSWSVGINITPTSSAKAK